MPFQPKYLNEQLIRETTESKVASIAPRRDIWRSVQEKVLRPKARLRLPWFRILATVGAVLTVIIAAQAVIWYNEDGRSSSPLVAVAEAYEGLFSLETVRYRIDGSNSDGTRFTQLFQVDLPRQIFYRALWLDDSVPSSDPPKSELLTIGGTQYVRQSDAVSQGSWRSLGQVSGSAPLREFVDLPLNPDTREQRYDRVRRLPDEEINGVPVQHYVAERSIHGDSLKVTRDTIHLWVGIDDGLPIKAETLHQERWSQPGAPVDLDKDWCEDSTGHVPGLTEMKVAYGLPSGVQESPDGRIPAHLLQPMLILCKNKEGTKGMAVWQLSEIPPGEEGYDLTVRWVYTFTEFNGPLELPDPLPGH